MTANSSTNFKGVSSKLENAQFLQHKIGLKLNAFTSMLRVESLLHNSDERVSSEKQQMSYQKTFFCKTHPNFSWNFHYAVMLFVPTKFFEIIREFCKKKVHSTSETFQDLHASSKTVTVAERQILDRRDTRAVPRFNYFLFILQFAMKRLSDRSRIFQSVRLTFSELLIR